LVFLQARLRSEADASVMFFLLVIARFIPALFKNRELHIHSLFFITSLTQYSQHRQGED
jgi:hypothetical protein